MLSKDASRREPNVVGELRLVVQAAQHTEKESTRRCRATDSSIVLVAKSTLWSHTGFPNQKAFCYPLQWFWRQSWGRILPIVEKVV